LATAQESEEFFSPPVPYALPALVAALTHSPTGPLRKLGQLQNVLVSLITSYVLLRLAMLLCPNSAKPRAVALVLLAMLPVYYKSFAFMRGEPFVAMFTLLFCDQLLRAIQRGPRLQDGFLTGIYGGLLLLSRQWGVLVLIGIGLWWMILTLRYRSTGWRLLYPGLVASGIALLIGGWFYLAMAAQTGSVLAFNRSADPQKKPAAFFTGLGNGQLFTYPFAPAYDGQILPILYTETWGDYFGFFYLPRPTLSYRVPSGAVEYMSHVNMLSILPTFVLLGGLIYGLYRTMSLILAQATETGIGYSLCTCIILASVVGFVWFLARYPSLDADTAKATYILQIFPLLCLLSAFLLDKFSQRWPRSFQVLMFLLAVVATHNILMYFSRIDNL
jgi:hypothetical protein